ncbi:MAG: hypothetical protein JST54_25905 [Deltaproteobacteria bacterium]|nr:hypothetical protein [Deltaproteobacteria bacterium]
MAIVIRYRCQRCGALWEGSSDKGAWIRCASCRALVDFDWQAFFESDEYRNFLKRSAEFVHEWPKYQALIAEGNAAAAQNPNAALASFKRAAEELMRLTPYMQPPEAHQPGAYREAVLNQMAWWSLQLASDPDVARKQHEIENNQRAIDYRNPIPTLMKTVELMRGQLTRFDRGDAPPDPDGMGSAERLRVWAGMLMGAFVQLVTGEQRLALMKLMHGEQNVNVRGDANADEAGLYFDWTCTLCGLTSLQARSVTELCCLGCYFRRPFRMTDLALAAVSATCSGCGAEVQVPAGALQATCAYCHAVSTRLGRTGQVEREFSAAIRAQYGGTELPEGGVTGFPVTAQNHADLVLTGLARTAMFYGALINAERYARVVRPSLKVLQLSPAAGVNEIRARVQREGGQKPAFELVEAVALLLR